jgi:hypothetical protein
MIGPVKMLLTLLQTLRQFQVEFKVLVRSPDMSIKHGVKRSDWFLVRGAAGSIKPGVERSVTPGTQCKRICKVREAADSGQTVLNDR